MNLKEQSYFTNELFFLWFMALSNVFKARIATGCFEEINLMHELFLLLKLYGLTRLRVVTLDDLPLMALIF